MEIYVSQLGETTKVLSLPTGSTVADAITRSGYQGKPLIDGEPVSMDDEIFDGQRIVLTEKAQGGSDLVGEYIAAQSSTDERLLLKLGIESPNGKLTEMGRGLLEHLIYQKHKKDIIEAAKVIDAASKPIAAQTPARR